MVHLTKPRTELKTWAWPRIAIVVAFCASVSLAGVQIGRALYVIPTPEADVKEFGWLVALKIDRGTYGGDDVPTELKMTISLNEEQGKNFTLVSPKMHDLEKDPVEQIEYWPQKLSDSKWEMTCPSLDKNGTYRMTVRLEPRKPLLSVDKKPPVPDPKRLISVGLVPSPKEPLLLTATAE